MPELRRRWRTLVLANHPDKLTHLALGELETARRAAAFSSAMAVPLPLPSPLKLNMSDTLVGRSTSSLSWLFRLSLVNNGIFYLYFVFTSYT